MKGRFYYTALYKLCEAIEDNTGLRLEDLGELYEEFADDLDLDTEPVSEGLYKIAIRLAEETLGIPQP